MTSCLHSTTTLRLDHGCWRGSRSPPGSPKAIFEVEPFGDAGLALATNPTDDARAAASLSSSLQVTIGSEMGRGFVPPFRPTPERDGR